MLYLSSIATHQEQKTRLAHLSGREKETSTSDQRIDLFCREDSANDEEAVQVKEKLLVRVHANSRASECPAVWGQDSELLSSRFVLSNCSGD